MILEEKMVRPILARQGNKLNLRKLITNHFPKELPPTNIEPFCGTASIFFNFKNDTFENYIINDFDTDVINYFNLVKNASLNSFDYPPKEEIDTLDKLKCFFDKPINDLTDEYKLIHYRIKFNTGYCNKPVKKSKEIYKNRTPYQLLNKLEFYKNKLSHVEILNDNYINILKQYRDDDVFFFLDPPYENTTKSTNNYGYDDIDLTVLFETLKDVKGKWLITLNDSEKIRQLAKSYIVIEYDGGCSSWKKQKRPELLIMNYN